MGFLELIKTFIKDGYAALTGLGIFGIADLILLFKNNKYSKELYNNNVTIKSLVDKVESLEAKLDDQTAINNNSNEMISATIDIIHVAYAGSSLDVVTKLQLQKIYDKCPDSMLDAKNKLQEIIEQEATQEQIDEVKATEEGTAVDTIINKLK